MLCSIVVHVLFIVCNHVVHFARFVFHVWPVFLHCFFTCCSRLCTCQCWLRVPSWAGVGPLKYSAALGSGGGPGSHSSMAKCAKRLAIRRGVVGAFLGRHHQARRRRTRPTVCMRHFYGESNELGAACWHYYHVVWTDMFETDIIRPAGLDPPGHTIDQTSFGTKPGSGRNLIFGRAWPKLAEVCPRLGELGEDWQIRVSLAQITHRLA